MSKGSQRRPGNSAAYRANHDRVFGTKKPASGRFVVRNGKLVPIRDNDVARRRSEIKSWGAGVLPEQVPEAREFCRDIKGIDFHPDTGDVIAKTPKAFDAYLAKRGFDPLS